MEQHLDPVEAEYMRAFARARDDEEAFELSTGLRQYREYYQTPPRRRYDEGDFR
jgi:hypothetical protein